MACNGERGKRVVGRLRGGEGGLLAREKHEEGREEKGADLEAKIDHEQCDVVRKCPDGFRQVTAFDDAGDHRNANENPHELEEPHVLNHASFCDRCVLIPVHLGQLDTNEGQGLEEKNKREGREKSRDEVTDRVSQEAEDVLDKRKVRLQLLEGKERRHERHGD